MVLVWRGGETEVNVSVAVRVRSRVAEGMIGGDWSGIEGGASLVRTAGRLTKWKKSSRSGMRSGGAMV